MATLGAFSEVRSFVARPRPKTAGSPTSWTLGHAFWEDAAGGGSSRRRAEGGESESELSLEVWSEARTPAIGIWCFMPDKAGDYVFAPFVGTLGGSRGGGSWWRALDKVFCYRGGEEKARLPR